MKKADSLKDFVEQVDASKKVNPKDLSSDQDLTIALMNLISIEEHLIFSGAKTGKNSYYDLVEDVRETRKNLMQQVIPHYEGEVWCISKHLLATSMRLMEVGTKQQSLGNHDEAYSLFNKAYDMYCLFWGLNMNMLNIEDVKWVEDKTEDVKKAAVKAEQAFADVKVKEPTKSKAEEKQDGDKPVRALDKMKAFVKKAVDCCIE